MSSIMDVLNPISAITDVATGVGNFIRQGQNLNYQKDLQKQLFAREDNAVQRRADDLEAAGLSKTLAAGSAAQVGAPIRTEAPQLNLDAQAKAQAVQASMKMSQDIARTKAENELVKLQAINQSMQNQLFKHDMDIYMNQGITSKATGLTRQAAEGGNFISKNLNDTFNGVVDGLKKLAGSNVGNAVKGIVDRIFSNQDSKVLDGNHTTKPLSSYLQQGGQSYDINTGKPNSIIRRFK